MNEHTGGAVLKLIRRLGRDAAVRREHGLMLCDGLKLLNEALSSGVTPVHVVTPSGGRLSLPPMPDKVIRIGVPERRYTELSPLDTPQPVLFTVPLPDTPLEPLCGRGGGIGAHIVLDRIQDPGNVGSIIRTACAFAIDTVILTPGCAELSNPKTLRAAMGTVFRQRVARGEQAGVWELIQGMPVYATGVGDGASELGKAGFSGGVVLIGNEGRGLSEFWTSKGLPMLTIPMPGGCESLGAAVAAALFMWEMKRGC